MPGLYLNSDTSKFGSERRSETREKEAERVQEGTGAAVGGGGFGKLETCREECRQ